MRWYSKNDLIIWLVDRDIVLSWWWLLSLSRYRYSWIGIRPAMALILQEREV